jgi:tRNA-2-methylthio-N6-dimethylallyladenosine synthase
MLYDSNPTLIFSNKEIDENKQGKPLEMKAKGTYNGRKYYIESYGCQMNFSDSEIVASVLAADGYESTRNFEEADLILINTCSIREKAEETVRKRLKLFEQVKKSKPDALIGVLGCMAERLKSKFLEEEKIVDIVCGPDSYRDLPNLINKADEGQKSVNVLLSREETYADINPVRIGSNGVSAFISITRGCNNMCSFCVVPFTRGRERHRHPESIIGEAKTLFEQGYREVTLLGQNVDSYHWVNENNQNEICNFAQLLEQVALINPLLRVRFSTSHPKDITDEVLHTIAKYPNICKYIHLPVQSGNSRILELMNRTYDRAWYLERIASIKKIIPNCGISSDIIAGFCSETEEEHQDTMSLMQIVQYDMSYMFFYSERPGTLAARKLPDDIPLDIKSRRLNEIIRLQNQISAQKNKEDEGKIFEVLVEGESRKSKEDFCGRNSQNKMVVFPKKKSKKGEYVQVKIIHSTTATLIGSIVEIEK